MYDRRLDAIVAAAELGSFSKAAERLSISTPALVKQVTTFEREFGVVAFERTHTGVRPTAAGASLIEAAAEAAGTAPLDLAILENVGNLVCPAEFDTGASVNVAILSVPEGDDKPLKYPLMFEVCDVVLVNKMDVAPYFDFDLARCEENVRLRNPGAKVIPMSAKTGEGTGAWAAWLRAAVAAWKTGTFEKATPANSEAPHYPGE